MISHLVVRIWVFHSLRALSACRTPPGALSAASHAELRISSDLQRLQPVPVGVPTPKNLSPWPYRAREHSTSTLLLPSTPAHAQHRAYSPWGRRPPNGVIKHYLPVYSSFPQTKLSQRSVHRSEEDVCERTEHPRGQAPPRRH